MSAVNALRFLTFLQLCFLPALAQTSTEKNDVKTENTDAFEILASIPYAEAIKDTNTNPLFKCLTARRIVFDPISPSATYEWSLNAGDGQPRKHATFYFTPGATLDTATVVINSNDSTRQTARYPYTDYTTCGIMTLDFEGHHCTLWVKNATLSVPEECHRQFTKICGEGVSLYDKSACRQLMA
nr:uncharacterized protein LOC119174219 [Rhipicephalus microplus]